MVRKRKKKDGYPDEWDVVEESQDPDELPLPFETVAETQDSDEEMKEEVEGRMAELSVKDVALPVARSTSTTRANRKPSTKTKQSKKISTKTKKTQEKAVRTKSAGTLRDKEYKKGKEFRSVICRLNKICTDDRLVEEIKRTARAMKQIQMETWHLVNLHSLRCLENGLPLPDYGKTFFDHCCAGVASTSRSASIAVKNPSLWNSIQIYRAGRAKAGLSRQLNRIR